MIYKKLNFQNPIFICVIAALFFFFMFAQDNIINSLAPYLIKDWHLSKEKIGFLSSIYLLALAISTIPAGLFYDGFSYRKLILMGMFSGSVGLFCFGLTNNFSLALIIRFVLGCVQAFSFVGCIGFATSMLKHNKAFATGLVLCLGLLGAVASQTPFAVLLNLFGWHISIIIFSLIGFFFFTLQLFIVKDPASMEITYCHNKASIVTELIKLSSEYRNWLLSLCACCMNLPIIILGALWGDMYLQKMFNFTHIQASYIITMMFVGFLVGAPILGLISDWLCNRKIVILGSSLVGLMLLVNIIRLQQMNLNLAMALFFCVGFFISAQSLCYTFITETNSSKIKNTAIGFAAVIVTLGGAVFQSIFTYILSITNSIQNNNFKSAFIFLLVSITASVVFSLAIQYDNNKNPSEV